MTQPTYNAMPPLSKPHKPTIPQMVDAHERQSKAAEAMKWLHRIACLACGIVMTAFAVSLVFRAAVGIY
jgi:hypothetical protein